MPKKYGKELKARMLAEIERATKIMDKAKVAEKGHVDEVGVFSADIAYDVGVSEPTARKYLNELLTEGKVRKWHIQYTDEQGRKLRGGTVWRCT